MDPHQATGSAIWLIYKRYFVDIVNSKEVQHLLLAGCVWPAGAAAVRRHASVMRAKTAELKIMWTTHNPFNFSTRLSFALSLRAAGACCCLLGEANAGSEASDCFAMLESFNTAAGAPSALLLMVIDPACVSKVYMYGLSYPARGKFKSETYHRREQQRQLRRSSGC